MHAPGLSHVDPLCLDIRFFSTVKSVFIWSMDYHLLLECLDLLFLKSFLFLFCLILGLNSVQDFLVSAKSHLLSVLEVNKGLGKFAIGVIMDMFQVALLRSRYHFSQNGYVEF